MDLGAISLVFEKVRTLCKECNVSTIPQKIHSSDLNSQLIPSYLNGLDQLRTKLFNFRSQQQEYKKLEEYLQKHQTQIRKHIGVEQQLKLYIDTLKIQYDESEAERIQLLENSKRMIKQLKKENEKMFQQVHHSNDKSKIKLKKQFHQYESVSKQRVHTIGDLDHGYMPKKKVQLPFKVQLSDRQNKRKKDQKYLQIKKKQPNFTMMGYLSSSKKKVSKEKTPAKKRFTKDIDKKNNATSAFKTQEKSNKKAHKSIFSISSIDFGKDEKVEESKYY